MAAMTKAEKQNFRSAHPVIYPANQYVHNHPHADVKTYFDAIFASDCPDYKGLVTIAGKKRGDTEPKIVGVVPADELGAWASQMHVSTSMDYYYGKVQHKGQATWGRDNAFAYNMISVDIDNHSDLDALSGKYIDALIYQMANRNIPEPNIVESSDRGQHLIWLIQQLPAELGWMVQEVASYYAAVANAVLTDLGEATARVDSGYSANIAGLTRIPGTLNTASGTYANYTLVHAVRLDLPKAYDSIHSVKLTHSSSAGDWANRRLSALLRLADIRPISVGERDMYFLHLYSAAQAAGMSNENAFDLVLTQNQSLSEPLPERELRRSLSSAARKHYKFTTSRIISDLNLSGTEQLEIGLLSAPKRDSNRARNERRRKEKLNRNKKILHMYLIGRKIPEIATAVGCAANTVRAAIRHFKDNLTTLFSPCELKRIFKQRAKTMIKKIRVATPRVNNLGVNYPEFKFGSTKYYAYTTECDGQMILGEFALRSPQSTPRDGPP